MFLPIIQSLARNLNGHLMLLFFLDPQNMIKNWGKIRLSHRWWIQQWRIQYWVFVVVALE